MKQSVLVFSLIIFSVLVLFRLSKYTFMTGGPTAEIMIGMVALAFLIIGLFLSRSVNRPNQSIIHPISKIHWVDFGLTEREFEVLNLIHQGFTNKEIGDKLHLAESTIKTHVYNLYDKLEVRNRTKAIQKAQELGII